GRKAANGRAGTSFMEAAAPVLNGEKRHLPLDSPLPRAVAREQMRKALGARTCFVCTGRGTPFACHTRFSERSSALPTRTKKRAFESFAWAIFQASKGIGRSWLSE